MTKRKAKAMTLKVWRYLAAHPEIKSKLGLPAELREPLFALHAACPLCEYFAHTMKLGCSGRRDSCPLMYCMGNSNGVYAQWLNADTQEDRLNAAQEIVRRVEAWEVK